MHNNEMKVGAFLSYIKMVIAFLASMLLTPIMLRMLGKSEYGLYMLIGALVGYISIFDFGLHNTIYRFISKYQAEKKEKEQENFIAVCLLIYVVISLIVIFVGFFIVSKVDLIFSQSLTEVEIDKAKIMSLILVLNLSFSLPMRSFEFIIRGYGKFIIVNSISIARIIIRTVTVAFFLLIGFKSIALVVIDSIINIIILFYFMFYALSKLKVKIKLHYINKQILEKIFSYSVYVFILAIVNQLFWKIGQGVLGIFNSTHDVAIFSLGITLVMYFQQLSLGVSSVFMPRISKMIYDGADGNQLTNLMIKIGRIQMFALALIVVVFWTNGKDFICLWAGEEYINSYWIAAIVITALLVPLSQTIAGVILQAKNLISFKAIAYSIMAIANLILSIIVSKNFGAIGLSLVTFVLLIIFQVIVINIYYKRRLDINVMRFAKKTICQLKFPIIITLVIGSLMSDIGDVSWAMFLIKCSILCLVYFSVLWIKSLNESEKKMLKKIVGKY